MNLEDHGETEWLILVCACVALEFVPPVWTLLQGPGFETRFEQGAVGGPRNMKRLIEAKFLLELEISGLTPAKKPHRHLRPG